jgi:SAM-dependent methyltransferase
MYASLAEWFPLITPPCDYADEAAFVLEVLRVHASGPLADALELGCGGGNLASYLKRDLRLTLTDISPQMLAVSAALNPECRHIEGDMRSLRLDGVFDAVVVHDAVMYLRTRQELASALATAFVHLRAGGAAVFLPDVVRETLRERTDHGGHDAGDRSLRYLEWTWDPDPTDSTFVVDYAFLLREGGGTARVVHDRHVEGVFPRAEWLHLLRETGFETERLADPWGRDVFVGMRP